jgi:Zn-dependent protease
MKWSWKLGRILGIPVYMHATFLLIIAWVALAHWTAARTVEATLLGVAFVLALFVCVLLHEFGHTLAARRYHIQTKDITLLPIGGLARLERMPEEPRQELWVALAGPAVNVAIAAVLFVGLSLTGFPSLANLEMVQGSFWARLMIVNIFLVLFNLLPAFPMDGGRVVRALLATRMDYTRATQIAASLGQGMAFLFGFVGLFLNPFLIFIALFVWIGAAQESSMVQMRSALSGIPVSRAMLTDFRGIEAKNTLADAVELILTTSQQDFPVWERGRLVGMLTRDDLFRALREQGDRQSVSAVMRPHFITVDSYDMLESAFARFQECGCQTIPVLHKGQLMGLLTTDNIGEFMTVQAALAAARNRDPDRFMVPSS